MTYYTLEDALFSPRTRGCSWREVTQAQLTVVFPAHAGMFPFRLRPSEMMESFPRARGDVPERSRKRQLWSLFSPRTRGCSSHQTISRNLPQVFPAHAGMFLSPNNFAKSTSSFPRARGDVPVSAQITIFRRGFSPRTRGCSEQVAQMTRQLKVFPAHAGMFPARNQKEMSSKQFSPRTRGCSAAWVELAAAETVFPAHAGMFRRARRATHTEVSFPRARGDVPE